MAQALPELSLNDWAVLGVVAEAPKHGWAVVRELAPGGALGRVWSVSRPLVYRSLATLTDQGLISESGAAPSARGPQRTIVRATPRGRAALRKWLGTPVEHVRDLRSAFLVKLALLDRSNKPVAELAALQLARLGPVVDAHAERETDDSFEVIVRRWRHESAVAAERFLRSLLPDAPHRTSVRRRTGRH